MLVIAVIGVSGLIWALWPEASGKYPVNSCFTDRELKVKFKVISISSETYEIEVLDSGHYSQSPDFMLGNRMLYLKSMVDGNEQFHPAYCTTDRPASE